MGLSLVTLLCFLGLTLIAATVAMLIRDLAVSTPGGVQKTHRLRRMPNVFDEAPARSIVGRVDQAFDRLILESGLAFTPWSAFLMLIATGLLIGGGLWTWFEAWAPALAGSAVGLTLPLAYISFKRHRRIIAMRNQLPDVLDMLSRAVKAGESLDQAIRLVAEEAGGELGREFTQCSRQLDMGRSLSAVVASLANRVRLMEFRILAATLSVQRQTGGNLAETLQTHGPRRAGTIDLPTAAQGGHRGRTHLDHPDRHHLSPGLRGDVRRATQPHADSVRGSDRAGDADGRGRARNRGHSLGHRNV